MLPCNLIGCAGSGLAQVPNLKPGMLPVCQRFLAGTERARSTPRQRIAQRDRV